MKKEPRLRKDGRCAYCDKQRRQASGRNFEHSHWLKEPFCSRKCLEAYFGIGKRPTPSGTSVGKTRTYSQK